MQCRLTIAPDTDQTLRAENVGVQGGANYKGLRRQQFASQLRFFRQLCTAAKVPLRFCACAIHHFLLVTGLFTRVPTEHHHPQSLWHPREIRSGLVCRYRMLRSSPRRRWQTQTRSSAS